MKKLMTALSTLVLLAAAPALAQDLTGAGASFPFPLYSTMFAEYDDVTGLQVNYQSIGSGGGQRQILEQTVDFGGSDAPMTDESMAEAPSSDAYDGPNPILHVPATLAAVVPSYNFEPIAENPAEPLVLSPDVLADIFLGQITSWQDPRITELNEGVELPDLAISVAHRSDGSGTTSIFVDYLGKVSETWASEVSTGPQTAVDWPAGFGGNGNEGVAGLISQIPGTLGYVSLEYAVENELGVASMINASGNVVAPTLDAVALAADVELPEDMRATFTNTDNPDGWPISGFSWVLVYQDQDYAGRSQEQAQRTVDLIAWMITEGQAFANDLNYAEIRGAAQDGGFDLLAKITYGDEPLEVNDPR